MCGSTSTSGIGKFNAATTTASHVAASSSGRVYGRSARYAISVSVRLPSRASSPACHGSISSGTYRPPSGARPSSIAVRSDAPAAAVALRAVRVVRYRMLDDASSLLRHLRYVGLRFAADVVTHRGGHRLGDPRGNRLAGTEREQRGTGS